MRLEQFDFNLPSDKIANRPVVPRDSARLLFVGDTLVNAKVSDLPDFLQAGDLLIVNDTRVVPARLFGFRGAARVQVTLDSPVNGSIWRALAYPARKLSVGDEITFPNDLHATVNVRDLKGQFLLDFHCSISDVYSYLAKYGTLPLPPYITRPDGPDGRDSLDYQTIYADKAGAVAAPTAGLHFTLELFNRLRQKGIGVAKITLHVGMGTFRPVTTDDVLEHEMASERGSVSLETANAINKAKAKGGRIVAVGSTALRLMESASDENGFVRPFTGETSIFITPGYQFSTADFLITNFHLPKSTLFMLVAAFSGLQRMKAAYAYAISSNYRFYSFGDASLLHRNYEK
jgi:S-adenosylmethionine:tRNA ribosyltransferase-isomerase